MKKLLTILVLLVVTMTTYGQFPQYQNTPVEDIDKGWATKPIDNVINSSLGIMLERFDQTWPTWMVGMVRDLMEKGLEKSVSDDETELTVMADTKNGYFAVGDNGTDGEYLSGCVWNRKNGHRLLAICLGKPTDPCIEVVCFYDYDPAKKTLTPEPDILKGYRWHDRKEFSQIFCRLPRKGKDVEVDDWHCENGPLKHTFTWDGMKPVYAKSEPLVMDEEPDYSVEVDFKGAAPNIKDFVNAMLSRPDMGDYFGGMRDSWKLYLNGMKQMPGDEMMVDVKNGYMGYVSKDDNERLVIECCYWNYSDKKHKLVALSNNLFDKGRAVNGQHSGIEFYDFSMESRKMTPIEPFELGIDYIWPDEESVRTCALPRVGRTLVFTHHTKSGKVEKKLTWNGFKFIEE